MSKSFWNKKKVLITGHTGFKGFWLFMLLNQLNCDVYGLSINSNNSNFYRLFKIGNKKSYFCDIRNFKKTNKIIKKIRPEILFHFAAQSLVSEGFKDFETTYTTNFIGTMNILKCIKNNKSIKTCLITTTDKVYENIDKKNKIYEENEKLFGSNPYSGSKVAKENLINSFAKSFLKEKNIVVVRSGNVIGGGDFTKTRLIPDLIESFKKKNKFMVRNIGYTRPWQHIYDVLQIYINLVKNIHFKKGFYDAYNVSSSLKYQTSVKKIISRFLNDKFFKKINIINEKKNKYKEDRFLNISNKKIKKFICIKPKFKNFNECLDNIINWYKIYLLKKNIVNHTIKEINF